MTQRMSTTLIILCDGSDQTLNAAHLRNFSSTLFEKLNFVVI